MPLIRSIHASAKTLLAHFHLISKGHLPFTIDWTNAKKVAQVSKIAELDDPEQAFLKKISPLIQSKGNFHHLAEASRFSASEPTILNQADLLHLSSRRLQCAVQY